MPAPGGFECSLRGCGRFRLAGSTFIAEFAIVPRLEEPHGGAGRLPLRVERDCRPGSYKPALCLRRIGLRCRAFFKQSSGKAIPFPFCPYFSCVYSSFQLAKKYLHYYVTAHNGKGHGMHSPFVFDFILHVLNNTSGYRAPAEIEALRKRLLNDKTLLQIDDLGAGSRAGATKQRTVQQIAKSALKPKKYARLLYRLVKHYRPKNIIELGTSLGITTAYLASANPAGRIITIEGSKAVAEAAQKNFDRLSLKNIQLRQGSFDDHLPPALRLLPSVDLAYLDGNHRYEPTMNYFDRLLSKAHNDSVFIFDDIHWSEEMERAWAEIETHPAVRCTADVFFLGFVFFRAEFKAKQHFILRF